MLRMVNYKVMRIWHAHLIPALCRQHLLACWREGLGAYSIIVNDKQGYRNHPAVQEFAECPQALHDRLILIRDVMKRRGYNPKPLPPRVDGAGQVNEWQSLNEQMEALRAKGCECNLDY